YPDSARGSAGLFRLFPSGTFTMSGDGFAPPSKKKRQIRSRSGHVDRQPAEHQRRSTMSETAAPRYEQEVPDVLKAMADTQAGITAHGLPRLLHHLVVLRASQINRCAFCVKMHTREAREDGETSERLDRLVVWDQVSDFTAGEKAAL